MKREHMAVFFGGPDDGRWLWATGSGRPWETLFTPERVEWSYRLLVDEPVRPLRRNVYAPTPARTVLDNGGYAVAYLYRGTR